MKLKINMLEPAIKISKLIVLLIILYIIAYFSSLNFLTTILGALLIIISLSLFIGVFIELKQDNILLEKHNKLKHHPKKMNNLYECQCCGSRFNLKFHTCPVCSEPLNYSS